MLLRSLSKHVKDQNWFAVVIDFIIVVMGVFIGIQVANWNESQVFNERETKLLIELKREIEVGINTTSQKADNYRQVLAAAKRSLAAISNKEGCKAECWNVLVDFMHASQWVSVRVDRSIYDELRRLGLPSNRSIIDSIEVILVQNEGNAIIFDDKPIYRAKIRQLIPFDIQEFYWTNCYTYIGGVESYLLNCVEAKSNRLAAEIVSSIINDPEIKLQLTFWAAHLVTTPSSLDDQNLEAIKAIRVIDEELKHR